ncbi:MAG: cytochrome C [Acidobacteria bacterium]|nr:cytochrome C [Acidobacteriota bacterium]NIM61430.1 cytochrome C [Acidobacteriota bacterium]NIO58093.1 cytochrome C [Acidobacteriota bacterium]NIQ29102.1 cytochrome C [Acidobacteriota bacterium]NIQ83646.1 cytochrome C [Acidobacteriota bacterium]
MSQIFPKATNWAPLVLAIAGPAVGILAIAGVWYFFSPEFTDVGYAPEQPIPYSHELHVGQLGLDCRYCHVSVETSAVSNIPPTQTCMNCHTVIKRDSELLAPLQESAQNDKPLRWVRVHNLPDYSFFDHSVHVRAGVGCVSCHGRIDRMEVVEQTEPLSMGWCLDCHRNPAPHLRPTEEVTNMDWIPPRDHAAFAAQVIEEKNLKPPEDCTACHR